jgi:hypothetical protein
MADNNNSIMKEVHQKPSAGVVQHILGSEQKRSEDPQFQKMSHESIAILIDSLADEINENKQQIQCIAIGGISYFEKTDDSISSGMFGAIEKMSESAKSYFLMKDLIAELRYRATSSTPADPIAKPAPAKPGQPDALQGARDAVWVAEVGMSCIGHNISPILVAIEALTHVDGVASKDLARRMEAIKNLAQVGVRTAGEMENTLDCEREAMQDKLSALEGASA